MTSGFARTIFGLHHWQETPPHLAAGSLAAPRVWAVPVVALFLLALLALSGANVPAFHAINTLTRALPDDFWACVTALGDTLPAFAVLLVLVARRPDAAAAALIAVLLATLATHAIKYGIPLPRPAAVLDDSQLHIVGPRLNSRAMPSGHTLAAFAVAALISGHTLTWRAWLPVIALAVLIALSRIAVGAHWPTDVLAGAAIGWLAGFAALWLASVCRMCQARAVHWLACLLFACGTLWLLFDFDSGYAAARWLERAVAALALLLFCLSLLTQRRPP